MRFWQSVENMTRPNPLSSDTRIAHRRASETKLSGPAAVTMGTLSLSLAMTPQPLVSDSVEKEPSKLTLNQSVGGGCHCRFILAIFGSAERCSFHSATSLKIICCSSAVVWYIPLLYFLLLLDHHVHIRAMATYWSTA